MKFVIVSVLLFSHALAFAQSAEITVLNGATREKKTYEVGTAKFDIPVGYVKGWKKCTALPLKSFVFTGLPSIRSELYCATSSGAVQSISCVASGKNNMDVTITTIYGANFRFVDAESILADSYAEITVACKNL
jgi:hypothetical protein